MARAVAVLAKVTGRSGRRSERVERLLLVAAVGTFAVAAGFAWQRAPIRLAETRPAWAVVAIGIGILSLVANAFEFRLSAGLLARPVPALEAIRVSVLSSAANVLPIPGAVIIRTRALRQLGEGLRGAVTVTTAVGVAWVAAAGVLAGGLLLAASPHLWMGVVFLGGSLLVTAGALEVLRRSAPAASRGSLSRLVVVELASVGLSGLRLYAVAAAASFDVGIVDAMAINFGGIVSHAAGIFPGGLGIKELLSGALAALVGVAPSTGVVMAVLDRLTVYLVLIAAVGVLLVRDRDVWRGTRTQESERSP